MKNVLKSAMASKLAYTQSHVPPVACGIVRPCYDRVAWIIDEPRTGVHAYAWKTGEESLLVAFKGTSTWKDLTNFFDSKLTTFKFCDKTVRVHSGMLHMFSSIEGVLNDELGISTGHARGPPTLGMKQSVTFCGHSLGGGIALLAAAYYGAVFHDNIMISCHAFGAPKVGDAAFYEWLYEGNNRGIRNIVINGDLVAALPLHIGYNADKRVIKEDVVNGFGAWINPLKCHDLDTYLESIKTKSTLL